MNSPQNENGKTNLPLNLCQETEACLTVDPWFILYRIDAVENRDLATVSVRFEAGVLFVCFP
jgi:hypothetical protein